MNKDLIKKIFLGEIGAGILLLIIQFIVGFEISKNIPYSIGRNFIAVFGIISIIIGIRKIKKER